MWHWQGSADIELRVLLLCLLTATSKVLAQDVRISTGLPSPPQFPNILHAFRESFSVSKELRLLTRSIADRLDVNCACGVSESLNSTGYPLLYSRDDLTSLSCTGEFAVIDDDGNKQLESAERMEQNGRAEVTRVIVAVVIFVLLFAVAVILLRKRCQCLGVNWVRRCSRMHRIQRQRSDCQEMINPKKSRLAAPFCCRQSVTSDDKRSSYVSHLFDCLRVRSPTSISCTSYVERSTLSACHKSGQLQQPVEGNLCEPVIREGSMCQQDEMTMQDCKSPVEATARGNSRCRLSNPCNEDVLFPGSACVSVVCSRF